jgi:hypothetical protein
MTRLCYIQYLSNADAFRILGEEYITIIYNFFSIPYIMDEFTLYSASFFIYFIS